MENIEFRSEKTGILLRGRFIYPEKPSKRTPCVIFLTGDGKKGSNSLSWVNFPPMLAKAGISSFLFDFQGLGNSDGQRKSLDVTCGLDNFFSAFSEMIKNENISQDKIGAFASSFGAFILLLSPTLANSLKAIGLKSPATFLPDAYYNEIGDNNFEIWAKNGFIETNGYDFRVFENSLEYNAFVTARKIVSPCLISQGDRDEIICMRHTRILFNCLGSKDKRFEIFQGASHGYSEGDSWNRMARMFLEFFKEKLLG